MSNLRTSRLLLVPATAELVGMELRHPEMLGHAIQASVPANWPPEQVRAALPWFLTCLTADARLCGWLCWYGLCHQTGDALPVLVASSGFFGLPEQGTAEIGYSVLPQYQGHGYATEMVDRLAEWALSHPSVVQVAAEIPSENLASRRVLEKTGFLAVGPGRGRESERFERRAKPAV